MTFVVNIVTSVVDTVVDVVTDVVDLVVDVFDWVVDDIITPVVNTVGDFIDAAMDDPIKTIAKIAAVATGNAWALPLIDGAAVVANGGDLGDALEAAAISYVAGEASAYAGDAVSGYVAEATGSELAKTIISPVLTGGVKAAASAAVYGEDPWEAFLQGGLSAGVTRGVNAAMGKIDAASGGMPATDTTEAIKGSFSKLPTPAQSIIKTALTAALTGQDVTEEMLASAVMRSQVVTEGLTQFFEDNPNLGDAEVQALTMAVQRSATAALSGGDVGDAISRTLKEYGQDAFNKVADKTVKNSIDKVRGTYEEMDAKVGELNTVGGARDAALTEHERITDNIKGKQTVMDAADADYQAAKNAFDANQNNANWSLLNSAIEVKNTATTAFNTAYEEYDQLKGLENTYNTNNGLVDTYTQDIIDIQTKLVSDADQLDEDMKPLYTAVDKAFVDSMTPDFNVAQYKKIHGLGDDVDGHQHWLTKGQYEGLATNSKDFDNEFRKDSSALISEALISAGLEITGLTKDQLKGVQKYVSDTYGTDGTSIAKMKTAGINNIGEELAKITQSVSFEKFSDSTKTTILADVNTQLKTNYTNLNDVPALDLAKTNLDEYLAFETTIHEKSGDITDEDILSGRASLVAKQDGSGLMEWENVGPNFGKWNSEFGQIIWEKEVLGTNGVYQKVVSDRAGNILYNMTATLSLNDDGSKRYDENGELLYDTSLKVNTLDPNFTPSGVYEGVLRINITPETTLDIDHLRETNPSSFMTVIGNAKDAAVDFTKNEISESVRNYGKLYDHIAEFTGLATVDEIVASDTFKDTAGVIVGGSGELLKAFNDMLIMANINPASSPLGKISRDMIALGGDLESDSYKAAIASIEARFAQDRSTLGDDATQYEADTWYGKAGNQFLNVWDGFQEAPGYFVAEFIAKELVQEVPVIAASIFTGGAVKVGMTAAKAAAKKMTQEVIDKAAKRAGMTAGSILDLAESTGGSAGGAFDEIYNEAINAGLSEAEAERRAQEGAIMAGVTGFITTGVSMGFLKGNAFEDMVTNKLVKKQVKDAGSSIIKNIANGVKVVVTEGVQEAFEEGVVSGVTATHILEFNPDYDVASNITLNATLGAIGGSGTVAGTVGLAGAGAAARAIMTFNPTVVKAVKNAAKTAAGAASVISLLGTAGIADAGTINDIANTVYSEGYTTDAEATNAFKVSNPGYVPEAGDLSTFTGAKPDANLATDVAAYVDRRFIDADEVKDAALAEGITLTDEQAAAYVGQKDEKTAIANIASEYDSQGTSRTEAEQFYADLGYTPSEQEILDRVGATPDADQKKAVTDYVNPRQTTEAEVRQTFADQGYEPSDEEVAARVGQGGENFATKTETDIGAYAGPRMVTDAEARQFFADLGYENPTDEQVAQFVAQVSETDQAGVIAKYVDTRQVTRSELETIANEEGLTLTDTLAAAYVGQGVAENFAAETLAGARSEYDPLATTQSEAAEFFANTGYTATPEEIAAFVASKTEETQKGAIGGYVGPRQMTAEESRAFLSEIGYAPTDEEVAQFTGQLNDANYQATQKAAIDAFVDPKYVDAGEVRAAFEELGLVDVGQEDIDRFVGQFAEEDQLKAVKEYAPIATTNIIKGIIGSPSVEDDPNTDADESKDATGIYRELEAGATKDEALEAALAKLTTDLGLTEDALLEEIGLTKTELSGEIDLVAKDVADVKEDVTEVKEEVGEVKEDVGDLADVLGTAGVEDDPTTELTDESKDATGLFATIKAYEDAGLDRDTALQKAVDDVATALGTTKTDLLSQIGETEATLTGKIDTATETLTETIGDVATDVTTLGTDLQMVADFVGKPAREVTQTDIDFVADVIAGGNITDELTLQYDVTGDGNVDIEDQNLLTDTLQGDTDTTLADTSMFNPATGLYLTQEQDTQTQLDAITDMNTEINTNIDTTAKQQNFAELQKRLAESGDAAGQQVTVTPGEKVQLDYQYDIGGDSIFATEGQAGMFSSPFGGSRAGRRPEATSQFPTRTGNFAQGGQVEDENDRLLRLLGGM